MSTPDALEIAPRPERDRLRALLGRQDTLREVIGSLEEEIGSLEEQLRCFEALYHTRLAQEEGQLRRLDHLIRHVTSWVDLLERPNRSRLVIAAERLEARRAAELRAERRKETRRADRKEPIANQPASTARPGPDLDALKRIYRRLVRRTHPDLAVTEPERLRSVTLLQRITDLYRAGDLARLETLAASLCPAEEDLTGPDLPERISQARERLSWFESVRQNRLEELRVLRSSELCRMWEEAEALREQGQDPFSRLRASLHARLGRRVEDVAWVYHRLEQNVKRHNRSSPPPGQLAPSDEGRLEPVFDPLASRPLVRWGLESLATSRASAEAQQEMSWVETLAEEAPATLRLLLFTHVAELTHLPLPGLETYDDLKLRFEAQRAANPELPTLEAMLAETSDRVEFGVRHATPRLAFLGLRFLSDTTRTAVRLALEAAPVRRAFRDVLSVLGAQAPCPGCAQDTFAVPLFRTRGLDELRATVCPRCGQVRERYYLPKGDDLQTVLNPAYLELGLVQEWTLDLGRAKVSIQLLPVEEEQMDVGALKARLVSDLFTRYELGIKRGQITLNQQGTRVPERTPLAALTDRRFGVHLRTSAPMSLRDAVERLRHRIRHRFE